MTNRESSLVSPSFAVALVLGGATLHRGRARAFSTLLASFLLFLFAAAFVATASAQTKDEKNLETLILHTRQGAIHSINIELAATPAEQSRGLMFRTRLPAKHGMLFLHDPPQRVVMWMKNTYLSLDMVFFDDEGKVVQIVEGTTPLSLARIRSSQPIAAVLELAAGSVRTLSLAKGDRAEHRFFQR